MDSNILQKKELDEKVKSVKMLILDVDGVLTDGAMYYTESGDEFKKFHTHDGMAIQLLREAGLKVAIISKEKSQITLRRAKKLKINDCFIGIEDKVLTAAKLIDKYGLTWEQVCYVGDDVNDIDLLKKVGLSVCPLDAVPQVKETVFYIAKTKGGEGVVRELYELYRTIVKPHHDLPENKVKNQKKV